jgi:putative resolvase
MGVNLLEWADRVGVPEFTACRWFREGTLPVPAERAGRLIHVNVAERGPARTVLDARIWPDEQRSDLGRPAAGLTGWAAGQGVAVAGVAAGAGSGMNGKRRRLARLQSGATATAVVAGHRDRLARSGAGHLQAARERGIAGAAAGGAGDDLVRDMAGVLTWVCARLYRRRGARNRAVRAPGCARRDAGRAGAGP